MVTQIQVHNSPSNETLVQVFKEINSRDIYMVDIYKEKKNITDSVSSTEELHLKPR